MPNTNRNAGFSMVELLIVIVIIGILAAIAVPGYNNYIKKANRTDAKAFLMQVANKEQQYFIDARQYADPSTVAGLAALGLQKPQSVADNYLLTAPGFDAAALPPAYTATLTGQGRMAGDYTYSINAQGVKTQTDSSGNVVNW